MFGREKTRKLIENIDRYFDLMDKTVLVFKDGVRNYLYSNKNDFWSRVLNGSASRILLPR